MLKNKPKALGNSRFRVELRFQLVLKLKHGAKQQPKALETEDSEQSCSELRIRLVLVGFRIKYRSTGRRPDSEPVL
jgi:hypothetical protein